MTNTEGPTSTLDAGKPPSPLELVERARGMIPVLRERAPKTEELRRLPEETLQDFVDAGFIRTALPEKWGGFGYDLEVIADIAGEIGRGCGSSGWLSSFYPCHQFIVTWFSDEAQAEYFGTSGPDTLSSTVSAVVRCEREEVEGGILVSGQWKFSSGVDYAEWVLLHTPEEGTLIPRSDFEIHDDWYVSGLRGTGSKGVILDKVFVPRHRIVTNEEYFTIQFPGAKTSESPYSKIVFPEATVMPNLMLAPIIGMAQGCLDVFEERVKSRKDPLTMQPAIERTAPQARFGEASAEVEAARLFMRHDLARLRRWGEIGEITMEERAALRRNVTYATALCARAANRLVDGMDSSALYESNSLHRLARDVRAGSLQFALAWDESALQYSRVKWGLEPQTVII